MNVTSLPAGVGSVASTEKTLKQYDAKQKESPEKSETSGEVISISSQAQELSKQVSKTSDSYVTEEKNQKETDVSKRKIDTVA